MQFPRELESTLRDVLEELELGVPADATAVVARLRHLRRVLAPELEFSVILSWLGKCSLVHRLHQEQLPLSSTNEYRVPDLFAVFEQPAGPLPVLIEVKTSEPSDQMTTEEGRLELRPHYLRYANVMGIPLLVAWRHRQIWSLFDFRCAELAVTNYHIGFFKAMEENLLGVLAGDFSYRPAAGTTLRLPIRKLTERDPQTGGFHGEFHDVHFLSPSAERLPEIPHLEYLFRTWPNESVTTESDSDVVQDFVIPEVEYLEFASRTLPRLIQSLGRVRAADVNWRSIIHDAAHLAHDAGRLRTLVETCLEHGVVSEVVNQRPRNIPDFLGGL